MLTAPSATPSEIQTTPILSALRERKPWSDVKRKVAEVSNRKTISNEKIKLKKSLEPLGTSFDAVIRFKQYVDEYDIFLFYDTALSKQYVFKTSKSKIELAFKMCSSESIISEEFCSFDEKDGRVKNFKTLTASAYHTLFKRQIPLAIMECKHEDSAYVELLWRLFSEAYKKANNTNEKFHPTGWSKDMATSNINGLERTYGEEILAKIKGCEFHFKDSVNKHAKSFEEEQKLTFKALANELLIALTEEGYRDAY